MALLIKEFVYKSLRLPSNSRGYGRKYKWYYPENLNPKPKYSKLRYENPYTEIPEYPAIEPTDKEYIEEKNIQKWYSKIQNLNTVEERFLAINMPRYYGWKCLMIHEGAVPYDSLNFVKHITKTNVLERNELPDYYRKDNDKCSELAKSIKEDLQDALVYQLDANHPHLLSNQEDLEKDKISTAIVVKELNRRIMRKLANSCDHLDDSQIDYEPRIEASWKVRSMIETPVKHQNPDGIPLEELPEEYLDRPSDKFVQYVGSPILQVRNKKPLPPVINPLDIDYADYPVEQYEYDPHHLGYEMDRRHVTNIPGFWPGDSREYSLLSYHHSNQVKHRPPSFGEEDHREALISQAITSSFGWLMPLAFYQGFTTFQDISYPLVTQTILTDGKEFTFATYQLNTTQLEIKELEEIQKTNLCWVTPTMKLYEEFKDGKLEGFNEETLKTLLQFYVNKPTFREGVNMKPFLNPDIPHVAYYDESEKREWLEQRFKYFSSNRRAFRKDFLYEVHPWERIFKIEHRMMPREPRLRPFERREQPYHKAMADVKTAYIPKALRPDRDLPKRQQRKRAKSFYPDCHLNNQS